MKLALQRYERLSASEFFILVYSILRHPVIDLIAIWRKGLGRAWPILTALGMVGSQENPLCVGDKRTACA